MTAPARLLVLVLSLLVASGEAEAAKLGDYFGVYVGRAEVLDRADTLVELRDIDVEITPFRQAGFRVRWINVTLVDGRRDVPGITRRVSEVVLEPRDGGRGLFVEARVVNPFSRQEEASPMAGDPLLWGRLDDDGLHVYSFAILSDGRFELQTYTRRLVEGDRLELAFERLVDGSVARRIEGHAYRAE